MKAHTASLINSITLIILCAWGYFTSASPSFTAVIPAIAGIILLALYQGVKKENKVIAHIAVVITLVVLIGLFKPLQGAMGRGDNAAIIRVIVMMLSCILAMIYFVKSFIDARKNRIADSK